MSTDWVFGWSAIASIATALTAIVLVVSAILVVRQLRQSQHASDAATFAWLHDFLQQQDVRTARGLLFRELEKKPFDTWSEEEQLAAEVALYPFAIVSQMASHRLVDIELLEAWGPGIARAWAIAEPFVKYRRTRDRAPELWMEFGYLAGRFDRTAVADRRQRRAERMRWISHASPAAAAVVDQIGPSTGDVPPETPR